MDCPRCGFPTDNYPCLLCGQDNFDDYELARYNDNRPDRIEITIIVKNADIPAVLTANLTNLDIRQALTKAIEPVRYFFISNRQHNKLAILLNYLKSAANWSMLVNGRKRPFTQELWLPLIELTESG